MRLRYALLPLLLVAAPAALAQQAADTTLTAPGGGTVAIDRDEYGVPAITADTEAAVFYGQGFAAAQDRLFQMEAFWRAATGRTAELNPTEEAIAFDQSIRTVFYTEAERQELFDALSEPVQTLLSSFVDGVNAYIALAQSDPDRFKPFEYTQPPFSLGVPIEQWDTDKVVAVMQFFMRRFGQIGGQELERLAELELFGEEWFAENRPVNDPSAPTTMEPNAPGAAPAFAPYAGPAVDPAVAEQVAEDRRRLEAQLAAMEVPRKLGSFAAAVAGSRTESGNVLLLGAPQMGEPTDSTKAVTWESELLVGDAGSPALHVAGMTVPGIPGVIIGRNAGRAWTLTTGVSDNTDTFVEVTDAALTEYLYEGEFIPFETVTTTIDVFGGDPVEYTSLRTVHGPVYATDPEAQQAFSWQFTFWRQELDMVEAFYDVWKAESIDDFEAAGRRVPMSFNLFYADKAQNIAFWHVGFYPVRPGSADPRLPLLGTGEQEWAGIVAFDALPQETNPPKGYFVNWNNKPAAWWNHGDVTPWTDGAGRSYDGVTYLEDHLQENFPLTFEELQELTCVVRTNKAYPEYPGTYQQVLEFSRFGSYAENLVPPGQSGFISTAGVRSPNFSDQWPLYESSAGECEPEMKPFTFLGRTPVSSEPGAGPVAAPVLRAAYPNPAADVLTVLWATPTAGDVRLDVVDLLGRTVAALADGEVPAGEHRASLQTGGLAAGVYVVRLTADGATQTRRLTVVR